MLARQNISRARVINVGELLRKGEVFVDLPAGFDRIDFSGLPQNLLERLITKPKLARYRAAIAATMAARRAVIISHMPTMTAAVATACKAFAREPPHLAFSFNFTQLPVGRRRDYFRSAFDKVTEFCVFSEFERKLYSAHFSLDISRIRRVNWSQAKPLVAEHPGPLPAKSYVCAIGGEGRDYASLLQAAYLLPHIPFVLVTRPHNDLQDPPRNVRLYCNIPSDLTWRIAADSTAVVVPLQSTKTCCGHLTLVGAQLLGVPLITTQSEATEEYTASSSVNKCMPGDHVSLASLIEGVHSNCEAEHEKAKAQVERSLKLYDRRHWTELVSDFLERHATRDGASP